MYIVARFMLPSWGGRGGEEGRREGGEGGRGLIGNQTVKMGVAI